jgi:outer membrane immunogenic protein
MAAGDRAASAGTPPPGRVFLFSDGCHDATGGTAGGQLGYRCRPAPGGRLEGQATGPISRIVASLFFRSGFTNTSKSTRSGCSLAGRLAWNNVLMPV